MTKENITNQYTQKIKDAESVMEKNLLKAEMNHKLKTLDLGLDAERLKELRDSSQFECEGCGS